MVKLQPVLKDYLWGGTKLKTLFGRDNGDKIIAESWEASVHKDGESILADGTPLSVYLQEIGEELPILIKYIDAKQNLSVQVHPSDAYAQKYEGDNGKTEMWYILSADEGAGIFCGLKDVCDKTEFKNKVLDGTVEDVLNFIPVKAGDCFLIKAGTLHAIGAGCVICEVQQNSNVTYRVYDYNRVDKDGNKRALHVDKALDVIRFEKYQDETGTGAWETKVGGKIRLLTECEYFRCKELLVDGVYEDVCVDSFTAVNVLSGNGAINGEQYVCGDTFFLKKGETMKIEGEGKFILSTKPQPKYYIGLDVGGTKCGTCVGKTLSGKEVEICQQSRFSTAGKKPNEVLDLFAESVAEYVKQYKIESIGIACGGPLDSKKGVIQCPPNLPDWDNIEIVKYFEDKFGIPTYLQNDANASAMAEWKFGAGKGANNVIFMTFGTGLGAGLILDGKLYEGTNGNAGEIGHVRLAKEGPVGFNKAGSAEGFCSGNGIRRLAEIRAREQGLVLDEALTTKDIFEKAYEGDTFFISVIQESAEKFGKVVSILIDLFNPEVIIAGGVFMRNYDTFMRYMQPVIEREALGISSAVCRVVPAQIAESVGDYSALAVAFDGKK